MPDLWTGSYADVVIALLPLAVVGLILQTIVWYRACAARASDAAGTRDEHDQDR